MNMKKKNIKYVLTEKVNENSTIHIRMKDNVFFYTNAVECKMDDEHNMLTITTIGANHTDTRITYIEYDDITEIEIVNRK